MAVSVSITANTASGDIATIHSHLMVVLVSLLLFFVVPLLRVVFRVLFCFFCIVCIELEWQAETYLYKRFSSIVIALMLG